MMIEYGYTIEQSGVNHLWYIFPKKLNWNHTDVKEFILEFTRSSSMEEAHEKIERIVEYEINSKCVSPPLRSREDAEKVARYFTEFSCYDELMFE